MTIIAVTSALLLCYSILLLYYKILWDSLEDDTVEIVSKKHTKISVIIPARDEEKNIGRLLDSIINQSYPKKQFEIIVVDDHSSDQTASIVQSYAGVRYFHLSEWIDPNFTNSFKKKALSEAIKRAAGEVIVTTDADCEVGPNWLQRINTAFQKNNVKAIAAPVTFFKKDTLLNIFQELDFIAMQGITAAVLSSKSGAMCNGANFAYTKSAFEEVNGYEGIDHLASGDDMMLMHKYLKSFPNQVGYLKDTQAIVQTKAASSLGEFVSQRVRWAGKNKSLSDRKIQFVLLLTWLTNAALLFSAFSLIVYRDLILYVILLFCIKGIAEYFFSTDIAGFFNRKKRLPFLFILQPLHVFYMTFVGLLGLFNTYTWKKRKVT